MAEAFSALTREALARRAGGATVTLKLERLPSQRLPMALVEWTGLQSNQARHRQAFTPPSPNESSRRTVALLILTMKRST
jgi:hypothetical protein